MTQSEERHQKTRQNRVYDQSSVNLSDDERRRYDPQGTRKKRLVPGRLKNSYRSDFIYINSLECRGVFCVIQRA